MLLSVILKCELANSQMMRNFMSVAYDINCLVSDACSVHHLHYKIFMQNFRLQNCRCIHAAWVCG